MGLQGGDESEFEYMAAPQSRGHATRKRKRSSTPGASNKIILDLDYLMLYTYDNNAQQVKIWPFDRDLQYLAIYVSAIFLKPVY